MSKLLFLKSMFIIEKIDQMWWLTPGLMFSMQNKVNAVDGVEYWHLPEPHFSWL